MCKIPLLIPLFLFFLAASCSTPSSEQTDRTLSWADSIFDRSIDMMDHTRGLEAIRFLDSAFSTKPIFGKQLLWRKYAAKANYYQYYDQNFLKRRVYVDSMLLVSGEEKEKFGYEYAHSLFAMATLLQDQKKYNEAFAYFYKGRAFSGERVDNCRMAEFNNSLGIIRYRQERYRDALPYLHQAVSEIQACKSVMFQYSFTLYQSTLNSIGLCHEKSGQIDSAIVYYRKALGFIRSHENLHPGKENSVMAAKGVVEGNLGGALAIGGSYSEAIRHLKADISINDRDGFAIEHAQIAKINLIRLYISHDQLANARILLDQLGKDLKSGRGKSSFHSEIWSRWYAAKSEYHEKMGDFGNALISIKKYHKLRDSLTTAQKELKNVDVDRLLREQHQRFEINLIQKRSQLKTAYLIGLSIFLLMVILIAVILWRYYHRSKLNVEKLTILNATMQQAVSALENSQRENTRLVKIVAHDLRSPVGAIAALSDMMIQESELSPDVSEVMTIIKGTAENSLGLVNNLMHLQQPQDSQLSKENVDLAALIRQCAGMLGIKAKEKQQQIHLDLDSGELLLNYEKIWRVVSNLISNAIKFSPPGGQIYITLSNEGKTAHLSVRDNGIGISPQTGNSIFDAFTKSSRKGTSGEESFGLGLSITKQIIEAHGGTITFNSEPNAGTTFHVLLNE